jgi:glutaredoxin
MKRYFVLAGLLLATLSSAQADTFRWVDKSGKVHYGDVPTEEATQVEQKKFGVAPEAADADLPYATRRARQNFPVTFYSASNCNEPCQQARDFLNKRGIPFTEKNLATQEDIDAFRLKSGSDTTPALGVGTDWLKGFEAGQWNSELDVAGYPRTAPYRPSVPPVAPSGKPTAK